MLSHAKSSILLGMAVSMTASALAGTPSETVMTLPPEPPAKDWWVIVAADAWVSAVDGDIGIRNLTASADATMGDVLGDLDFAYMGYFEFGYQRWSLGIDGIYAKLSDDTGFTYGPIDGRVSLEQEQAFLTVRAQYRAVQTDKVTLDVFGGFRWSYVNIDTDVTLALSFDAPALQRFNREGGRRFDLTRDWVDPIIGFRSVFQLSDSWFLQLAGDIGGFGVSSELTWHALAGIGYNFTPSFSTLVGYRALGIDYHRDNFKLNTISHGPIIALALKF